MRFLVGHGFKLLLGGNETTAADWKRLTAQADQRSDNDRRRTAVQEKVVPRAKAIVRRAVGIRQVNLFFTYAARSFRNQRATKQMDRDSRIILGEFRAC